MVLFHIGDDHLPRASTFVEFLQRWDLAPYILIPLAVICGAYLLGRWRLSRRTKYRVVHLGDTLFFVGGGVVLTLVLVSPIDVYGGDLFFMHMIQHLSLMMIAAPLLLLASPMAVFLWAFPGTIRHQLGRAFTPNGVLRRVLTGVTVPVIAWLFYVVVIWAWHVPVVYDKALEQEWLHIVEHLVMFGAAVIFWWPVIGPAPIRSHLPYPFRFLYLFLALSQNIVLAAILTFADSPVYAHYEDSPEHWGLGVDLDQQLGGILMWLPGAMMYFTALGILFYIWVSQEEREIAHLAIDAEKRRRYLTERGTL